MLPLTLLVWDFNGSHNVDIQSEVEHPKTGNIAIYAILYKNYFPRHFSNGGYFGSGVLAFFLIK